MSKKAVPGDETLYPELKEPRSPDRGVGIIFKDESGGKFKTVARDDYGLKVRLSVSTFRGMCGEAVHFYGLLRVSDLNFECLANKDGYHEVGEICNICGSFDKFKPKEALGMRLDLKRFLTKGDLRTKRFKDYRHFTDPDTSCFDTEEEVRKEARRVFDKFFGKGWTFQED